MKVIACGGSIDGTWVELSEGVRDFRRIKPAKFDWKADLKAETSMEYEEYRVLELPFPGGYRLKVAVIWGPEDDDTLILKTILQRDVFAHLTDRRATPHGG